MTTDDPARTHRPARPRLVLVRHGQTPSNLRQALDTVPPGPGLTDAGREQATRLAERLSSGELLGAGQLVAVHASRALRAQQTAEPVAARHGLPVQVLDGLHEVYVGELEGADDPGSRQKFEDIYASWHRGELDASMPGGETGRQALERFLSSARRAVDGAPADGVVVLVSHGAMLRLAAAHLASNVDRWAASATHLPNTGLIVLDPLIGDHGGWQCVLWDGHPGNGSGDGANQRHHRAD